MRSCTTSKCKSVIAAIQHTLGHRTNFAPVRCLPWTWLENASQSRWAHKSHQSLGMAAVVILMIHALQSMCHHLTHPLLVYAQSASN